MAKAGDSALKRCSDDQLGIATAGVATFPSASVTNCCVLNYSAAGHCKPYSDVGIRAHAFQPDPDEV